MTQTSGDHFPSHDALLTGIGVCAPTAQPQERLAKLAEGCCCDTPQQRALLERLFSRSGVSERGTVLIHSLDDSLDPIEAARKFYPPRTQAPPGGPSTAQRMDRYAAEAPALAHSAAQAALDQAQISPARITHLFTVSCTGFFAPGLDIALIASLGLARDVHRLHVGFMGCHGAFNALAAARDAVRADPDAVVLVCSVELSTLHFGYEWDPESLVPIALFADGAAAAIIQSARPTSAAKPANPIFRLRDTASFLVPNSLDAMTWHIGDHGFRMTLSAQTPALIHEHVGPWCRQWLARHDLTIPDIARWAIHPGGPRILSAAAEALTLASTHLDASRHILAHHGNMSSATVLFLLQELARRKTEGPCVALGFGPGLMAEGMLFI